jgi:hypothetical protein
VPPAADPTAVELEQLRRPLQGDPAALYRLRIPATGGLRLALLVAGERGRMTISERFGSAASITSWVGRGESTVYDLREGCRIVGADVSDLLGVTALPMPQAVRLMVGRLPALPEDVVWVRPDGRVVVDGGRWTALVTLRPDPWRVVEVRDGADPDSGWRITVSDHSSTVPSELRIRKPGGRWAELDLVRLEWKERNELPALPDLPVCVASP